MIQIRVASRFLAAAKRKKEEDDEVNIAAHTVILEYFNIKE